MLYFNFKNYEEFKEIFGIVDHGNGQKSRKNKILLTWLKSAEFRKMIRENITFREMFSNIRNMAELKKEVLRMTAYGDGMAMRLAGKLWHSKEYEIIDGGVCFDGDGRSVRYQRQDNGKIYKMKASKMYKHLIDSCCYADYLCPALKNWLVEELTSEWYAKNNCDKYNLHINKDFEKIYSSEECAGDMGSCMEDEDYYTFYENAVNASAAYLTDDSGMIVARAIIFNDVRDDDTGETFRLLERQYSTGGDELLKNTLIQKCICAGAIDGYKKPGAGCRDNRAFVANDGMPMNERYLSIGCDLEMGDAVSYQDSFTQYSEHRRRAYNYGSQDHDLATTEGVYGGEWDDWNECWCRETQTVYYHGQEYQCDVDRLDAFVFVDSRDEYHHEDDCVQLSDGDWALKEECVECEECGEWVLCGDSYYSDITDQYYCCEYCMIDAEDKYMGCNNLTRCAYCGEIICADDEHRADDGECYCNVNCAERAGTHIVETVNEIA